MDDLHLLSEKLYDTRLELVKISLNGRTGECLRNREEAKN